MDDNCVYHSDKILFNEVCQSLKKLGIIPKKCLDRYAMAVCSCRQQFKVNYEENGDSRSKPDPVIIQHEILDKLIYSDYDVQHLRNVIDFINTVAIQTKSYYSGQQFLLILNDALNGDVSNLKSLCKAPLQKKVRKFNEKNFSSLINKKKRLLTVRTKVVIPLFGGNTRYLESHESIGKKFSTIGKKFNSVIEIDGTATRVMMDANKKESVLKVWCKTAISYERLAEKLIDIAKGIQKQHQQISNSRRPRPVIYRPYQIYSAEAKVVEQSKPFLHLADLKTSLSDVFAQKDHMRKKDKRRRVKGSEVDVLANGHCLYCMVPYNGLHQSSNDCQYHPGYKVKECGVSYSIWTCCKAKVDNENNNGCTLGKHIWRPHKKASRNRKQCLNDMDI